MKENLTKLVFIVDRSGSMSGLESDTIGGFNSMLKEQQAAPGEASVTTVLFDDQYELLHDKMYIRLVAPLTTKDYTVRGSTALLDAVGKTIKKVRKEQRLVKKSMRAEKVMFVIITDGHENASTEYTSERIKNRIERQRSKHGWEFVFFGANMDAIMEAAKLGIAADRAQNYEASPLGTGKAWGMVSAVSTSYRSGNIIKQAVREAKDAAASLLKKH